MNREQMKMLDKKAIEKMLKDKSVKSDNRFKWLLTDLDKSKECLDGVDKSLELFHETARNKKRHQFEDWNANVHGALQRKIASEIDSMDSKTLNKRKNDDYAKFLDITDRKSCIFLDIIIESEYDPLEPNTHVVKTRTATLKDPTHVSAQKDAEENSMLGASNHDGTSLNKTAHGSKAKCKDMLPVEQWASGKIEGTPYGSFAKLMTETKEAGEKKLNGTQKSSVIFDHYNYPKDKASVELEMPRGKRIHPQTMYANPSRVFNQLPVDVQLEIASIGPPENKGWLVKK